MEQEKINKLKENIVKFLDEESKRDFSSVLKDISAKQTIFIGKFLNDFKNELLNDRKKISEAIVSGVITDGQQFQMLEKIESRLKKLEEAENKTKEVIVKNQVKVPKLPDFPKKIEVSNFPESDAPVIVSAIKALTNRLKAAATAFISNRDPKEAIPVVLTDYERKRFYTAMFNMGGVSFDTSTIENNTRIPSSIGDGRKVVTAAGTRERLVAASTGCKYVDIMAEVDNTGEIVVGGSTVVATAATRRGIPLYAGQSIRMEIGDLYNIYIDATVNGEGVTFTYYN